MRIIATIALVFMAGCTTQDDADVHATTRFSTSVPERVLCQRDGGVRCNVLRAELYISGYRNPDAGTCFMRVDENTCEVSGTCHAISPRERTLTLDYLVRTNGQRVLLAQAVKTVDLRESQTVEFTENDFVTTARCQYMPACDNSAESCSLRQPLGDGGPSVPVCDLDEDGRSNLDEMCAGTDPQGP